MLPTLHPTLSRATPLVAAVLLSLFMSRPAPCQDMPLSDLLIPGEDWEVVSRGHAFTDAPFADAKGNFFFADVKEGTAIYKIGPDGKVQPHIANAPGVSGAVFGPDGRIYACQPKQKRVVAFDPSGKVTVLAEDVQPNDLVVSHRGGVYFTETRAQQISYIDPQGKIHPRKTSIVRPNGIAFSADRRFLAVSDHGGKHVWTYRVKRDGTLGVEQAYMTMKTPPGTEEARGDGMTTDEAGRYYVTTAMGLQVFDPSGRLSGVILKPQDQNLVSAAFAGPELAYLHVACGDTVFRRKTRAKGALFFQAPKRKQ